MTFHDEAMAGALAGEGELDTVVFTACEMMDSYSRCAQYQRMAQWIRAADRFVERYGCPYLNASCRIHYGELLFATTVEDTIAEGDRVVTRYTVRGTHQGEIEEFGPPTGRQLEFEGITVHHIEDGKIVEEWERYDNLGILQQLGLVPEQH